MLPALEQAKQTDERKRLYEALHPAAPVKAGRPARNSDTVSSFTAAVATDKSQRSVQRDVSIARRIPDDVRETIRETPLADKKVELLTLSRLDDETQRAGRKTPREALIR